MKRDCPPSPPSFFQFQSPKRGPAAPLPIRAIDVAIAEVVALLQPDAWRQAGFTLLQGNHLLERTLVMLSMAPPGALTTPDNGGMELWVKGEGRVFPFERGTKVYSFENKGHYQCSQIGSMARPFTMESLLVHTLFFRRLLNPDFFYPPTMTPEEEDSLDAQSIGDYQYKLGPDLCAFVDAQVDFLIARLSPEGAPNLAVCRQLATLGWGIFLASEMANLPGNFFSSTLDIVANTLSVFHGAISSTVPVAILEFDALSLRMRCGHSPKQHILAQGDTFNLAMAASFISDLSNDILAIRKWYRRCAGFATLEFLLSEQPDPQEIGISAVVTDKGVQLQSKDTLATYGPYSEDPSAMLAAVLRDFDGLISPFDL